MKINVAKLKPMAGYVLVEPAEKEGVTASGLIVPTEGGEKPQYGKVLAVGEHKGGKDCECGKIDLKAGEMVIYKKWGGNDVKIEEIEYQFLKFEDILAKIQ